MSDRIRCYCNGGGKHFVSKEKYDQLVEALKFYYWSNLMAYTEDDGRKAKEVLEKIGEL